MIPLHMAEKTIQREIGDTLNYVRIHFPNIP
jgi:hypothetical protein